MRSTMEQAIKAATCTFSLRFCLVAEVKMGGCKRQRGNKSGCKTSCEHGC